MRALLDVNVLLALFDRDHVDHAHARRCLDAEVAHGWASCAITQSGFVQIVSQPRCPSPVAPAEAIERLDRAARGPHLSFWPCDVSLADPTVLDRRRLHGARQVTDAYLTALAVAHDGRFVTFDRAAALEAVAGAEPRHLHVL